MRRHCNTLLSGVGFAVIDGAREGVTRMSFQEAVAVLSRDERFRATIYAMNSLLIQKGVYSQQEFERMFMEWTVKQRATRVVRDGASLSTAVV